VNPGHEQQLTSFTTRKAAAACASSADPCQRTLAARHAGGERVRVAVRVATAGPMPNAAS
jgi:hypothetical protein